ncbi:MAG: Fic family protein [Lachnospiraceae bacterium]|nr:Fic family protein [Lachnospiraceae bacterium]
MKLGEKVTEEVSPVDENTKKFINLLDEILKDDNPKFTSEEKNIREVLYEYERALTLLDQYDHQNMVRPVGHKATKSIDYQECKKAIDYMKERSFLTSDLFGKEKDDSFNGAIANIEQTYNDEEVYGSVEEKAAHLLYFATKNHGFYDGNKRIAAAMFLYYLNKNDRLFLWGGKKAIEDSTVAALTVMIAESRPEEKEMMINMIMNCL